MADGCLYYKRRDGMLVRIGGAGGGGGGGGGANVVEAPTIPADLPNGSFWWDTDCAGSTMLAEHGLLAGLADDDHPQYLTEARGDARYAEPVVHYTAMTGTATGQPQSEPMTFVPVSLPARPYKQLVTVRVMAFFSTVTSGVTFTMKVNGVVNYQIRMPSVQQSPLFACSAVLPPGVAHDISAEIAPASGGTFVIYADNTTNICEVVVS